MTELLSRLFDNAEYTEISGKTAAFGEISGVTAYAYVQDMSVKSGAVNKTAAAIMRKVYASAVKFGAPVVAVFNSKGGEIGEGLELIDAYSDIIGNISKLSGVVPLISVVTGQCSGLNATICSMSDFVITAEEAEMFLTPPFLGGNAENTADIAVKTAEEAVFKARELLSILPPNNLEPAFFEEGEFELSPVLKFSALNGSTVGFVTLTDKLTAADTSQIARFVSFCDNFSLPLVTIIDCNGFVPDVKISDTAKLAQVYAGATTPRISVIIGNATGAAFILTGGFSSDFVLAYENAIISPIPVKAAAAFLEISEDEYITNHANVQKALEKGYVDAVISPGEQQDMLIKMLEIARNKRVASIPRKRGI
jgi:acetyl-CoA carboxylase carboxyltransferase component